MNIITANSAMVATEITVLYGVIISEETLLKYFDWGCDCDPDPDHDTEECTSEKLYEKCGQTLLELEGLMIRQIPHDDGKRYYKKSLASKAKKYLKAPTFYVLGWKVKDFDLGRGADALDVEIDSDYLRLVEMTYQEAMTKLYISQALGKPGLKFVKNVCSCCS